MKKEKSRSRNPKNQIITVKLVVFSLVFFIFLYFVRNLTLLSYFNVKDIIVKDGSSITIDQNDSFDYLKGKNIFEVDLKKEAKYIQDRFSEYRRIRLLRFLPNRLCIELVRRKTVACIKSGSKFYCIDENMTFFDGPLLATEQDVPMISGLEKKNLQFRTGRRYNIPELAIVFSIIKEKKSIDNLKNYKIVSLDVSNINNVILTFSNQLQVRITADDIKDRMSILGNLLVQVSNSIDKIEYIDFRFKEPVIKLKNPV